MRRWQGGRGQKVHCHPDFCDDRCREGKGRGNCRSMDSCPEDSTWTITRNTDPKTLEMGLFPGMEVHILKNSKASPSLLVAVGESRYAIHRDIACQIRVK